MDSNGMGCIICATRGGAGSRAVQEKAIEYARERECTLIFLYVVDVTNLDEADEKLIPAVREELYWVGQTLLRIAQRRAESQQVTSEIIVREGQVQVEIIRLVGERSAETLLMGAPRGTTVSSFGDDFVEQLAQEISEKTGVSVEIVRPEQG
jgi:nucleotide-binding universal stress UspA family protein